MHILGFFGNFYRGSQDGSCVILEDGKVISAVEEERLLRIKHAVAYMPERAISYSLAKIKKPLKNLILSFPQTTWKDFPNRAKQFFYYKFGQQPKKILYFNHHLSHAASSFYASGFKESAILTADQSGDGVSGGLYYGKNGKIKTLKQIDSKNSLGTFYALITEYLGFIRNLDEYKVMGLSAFGKPLINLDNLLQVKKCYFRLNTKFINDDFHKPFPSFLSGQQPLFNSRLDRFLGTHRLKDEKITQKYKNIAASTQKKLEETVLKLVECVQKETGSKNLCVAGGVFLNCSLNGVISRSGLVKKLYVPPVAGDNGVSLGAAYLACKKLGITPKPLPHAYLGTDYDDKQIAKILTRSKVRFSRPLNIEKLIARQLSKGKIVGHFNGSMEYGPRALGNRSILADPRDPQMKDKINKLVKFREEFRPFAPSVLLEEAQNYFENITDSPFMTVTFKVKSKIIPSVTHVDNTSRVQTVRREINERFWNIINEFQKITNVPVVLNTSLNRNFEPIVESPDQALAVFASTGMDVLVLGNYWVEKQT